MDTQSNPTMTLIPTTEGSIDFLVSGLQKPCKTWYKIIGHLSPAANSTSPKNPPLIILHGGPGAAHEYLLPFTDLYTQSAIPLIFYDQIGNGRSTHLPEKAGDESFWTESLFHHELDNLIDHFGLRDSGFDILGQSWGGMMGSSYAALRPKGLRRLVLANAPADIKLWKHGLENLRVTLPEDVQKALREAEETGDFESKEYEQAVTVFYQRHLCTTKPWPAKEVEVALKWMSEYPEVYATMYGPSELTITGTLRNWSVLDKLSNIAVPTLVYNGAQDEAQDVCVAPFFWGISHKVKWVTIQNGSHFCHVEHREQVMRLVGDFLGYA